MWLKAFWKRISAGGDSPNIGQRRWYQITAALLIVAGLLLLAYTEGWLPGPVARAAAFWPAGLILAGLGLLYAGRPAVGFGLPRFVCERGSSEAGEVWVEAGMAEVRVQALTGADQLAVGAFPNHKGPKVEVEDRHAKLTFDWRRAAPLLSGPWDLALNAQVPWTLHLRSGMGAVSLNLHDLPVTALDLYAWAGPVDLTLPAAGQGEMRLRLVLGDLHLRLPKEVGLQLQVKAGPLANLSLNGSPLTQVAPGEWNTPDYAAAPHRFVVTVDMTGGDLRIS